VDAESGLSYAWLADLLGEWIDATASDLLPPPTCWLVNPTVAQVFAAAGQQRRPVPQVPYEQASAGGQRHRWSARARRYRADPTVDHVWS
jgi:hypothetical protein